MVFKIKQMQERKFVYFTPLKHDIHESNMDNGVAKPLFNTTLQQAL